jgi:hypothetical protein
VLSHPSPRGWTECCLLANEPRGRLGCAALAWRQLHWTQCPSSSCRPIVVLFRSFPMTGKKEAYTLASTSATPPCAPSESSWGTLQKSGGFPGTRRSDDSPFRRWQRG